MQKEIGIISKDYSMKLERTLRLIDNEKYDCYSSILRENVYKTLVKMMCNESLFEKEMIVNFIEDYYCLKDKTLDSILELSNGEEIINDILSKLDIIINGK